MAEINSHEEPEDHEVALRFGIETPLGMIEVDLADLPERLREALANSLDEQDLPEVVRAELARALGPGTSADSTDHGLDETPLGARLHDYATELHQSEVWDIADNAFPNDPHLWKAMELLFTLSAANPEELTELDRRDALKEVVLHLERHIKLMGPPLSFEEQLVQDFRKKMGF